MATEAPKWVPPYISFTSLLGLIDRMKADGGAPPQIDRSYLAGFSGGYQSQVIAAMKSLALIEENGTVTSKLTELVEAANREAREPIIKSMLEEYFPGPVRLGAIKATQGQLEAAFKEWGITGDTLRKAIAFYLAAAKYSGVPLSTNFKVPSVAPGDGKRPRKPRGAKRQQDRMDEELDTPPPPPPPDRSWQAQIEPPVLEWLKRIPVKGAEWPKQDRGTWTTVLTAILDGIYGAE
ncbi:MAG: hypothetical protein FIA92_10655 [Chloroflexi bacterium]|nr:hypothetical protein [Chloroflexota bacterium]